MDCCVLDGEYEVIQRVYIYSYLRRVGYPVGLRGDECPLRKKSGWMRGGRRVRWHEVSLVALLCFV